jgi:hypothetical protein
MSMTECGGYIVGEKKKYRVARQVCVFFFFPLPSLRGAQVRELQCVARIVKHLVHDQERGRDVVHRVRPVHKVGRVFPEVAMSVL